MQALRPEGQAVRSCRQASVAGLQAEAAATAALGERPSGRGGREEPGGREAAAVREALAGQAGQAGPLGQAARAEVSCSRL